MFAHEVPIFVSVLFLIAILFPVFMIASLLKVTGLRTRKGLVVGCYLCYFALVSALCFLGVFKKVTLPPKIIVVTTLPLLAFYIIILSNTRFYKTFLNEVPLSKLVRVHLFRLVGSFFLILYVLDQLPLIFAFVAGLGDVITAVSAVFVAKALTSRKSFARKLTWIWNTFGLFDILLTSAMAVYLTKVSMETGQMGVDVLAQFPFCLIPAFAPPTIIFLHLTIYRKLFDKDVS